MFEQTASKQHSYEAACALFAARYNLAEVARSAEIGEQMLRNKLYDEKVRAEQEAVTAHRRSQVSSGDRSAKIRTYNYPQGRVTDHRINLTLYNLSAVMDGDIQEIIDKLQVAENAERLRASEE